VLVLALLLPTSAYAIFGLGDIVFDPSNYAEAVAQLGQDIQIVSQAVQTYNLLKSELAIITSRPWQTLATTLASIQVADLGDEPSAAAQAIAQAVNGTQDARTAWSHANLSINMDTLNNALGSILSNTAAPAHANAIEMTDAFATRRAAHPRPLPHQSDPPQYRDPKPRNRSTVHRPRR